MIFQTAGHWLVRRISYALGLDFQFRHNRAIKTESGRGTQSIARTLTANRLI